MLAPMQAADAMTAAHFSKSQSSSAAAKLMASVMASVVVMSRLMIGFGDAMPVEATSAKRAAEKRMLKVKVSG